MKHVPVPISSDPAPDLERFSLPALCYLLKHRELWPLNFRWNYAVSYKCAIGLTYYVWKVDSQEFLSPHAASMIFCCANDKRNIPMEHVTPEMVADDIDEYLRKTCRTRGVPVNG